MKRKFITNLILLLFLNLLVKPFWVFGIDRKVQNIVGAEEYGLYFSLFSLSLILNILLDIGIINFNNRSIARDNSLLKDHLSKIIPLKFTLAFLYAFIVLVTGLILNYSHRQFELLGVLIINQFLLSFILYLRSNISGLHYFRTDSIISVLDRFIMIVICGILIWTNITGGNFKIEWFIYAQTVSYILTFFIAFGVVLSKSGSFTLKIRWKYSLEILRQSYPFAILILLMSFFNRIDSVMIERILPDGKEQAGIYAQGFRILDAAAMFAFLFAGLLLPIFSKMIRNNEAIGDMVRLSFSLLIIPAFTLAIISFFYNKDIISLLYEEHIEYSSRIFRILIIGFVFISTSYIFGTLLTANGSLKALNILALTTVILNVGMNLILIPRHGALGAAIASIGSQGFYAFLQIFISRKIFQFHINFSLIIRLLLFIILTFLLAWFFSLKIEDWFIGFILSCIFAVFITLVLKIITPRSIYRIIKYNE